MALDSFNLRRLPAAGFHASGPCSTALSRIWVSVTSVSLMLPLLIGLRRCPRLLRIGWPAAAAARIRSRSVSLTSR
jgi:hypothetical protein